MTIEPDSGLETHVESPGRRSLRTGTIGVAPLVMAGLALGMLVGLAIGWISFRSPLSDWSRPSVLYDEELVRSLFEKASPAVVEVSIVAKGESSASSVSGIQSTGSGFLVDKDGHIVTNHHVVSTEGEITVELHDGRILPTTKLGSSPSDDLALLQVDPDGVAGIHPLSLANSDDVRSGEMAIAIGSSFRDINSVTVGVVSGVGRSRDSAECVLIPRESVSGCRPIPGLIQTDAALNPGNSGGPLLNSAGEVIGVTSSVEVVSTEELTPVQIGVGFAIPSNTISGILTDLMSPGELKRPWIGISGIALDRQVAASLGLTTESGIYIA